jgi:hypothetical protein
LAWTLKWIYAARARLVRSTIADRYLQRGENYAATCLGLAASVLLAKADWRLGPCERTAEWSNRRPRAEPPESELRRHTFGVNGSTQALAHGGKQRRRILNGVEFLRRFFLHVLPKGFERIRNFGFVASRLRTRLLAQCRQLLPSVRIAPYVCKSERSSLELALSPLPCARDRASRIHLGGPVPVQLLRSIIVARPVTARRLASGTSVRACSHVPSRPSEAIRTKLPKQSRAIPTVPPRPCEPTFCSRRPNRPPSSIGAHRSRPPQTRAASF